MDKDHINYFAEFNIFNLNNTILMNFKEYMSASISIQQKKKCNHITMLHVKLIKMTESKHWVTFSSYRALLVAFIQFLIYH